MTAALLKEQQNEWRWSKILEAIQQASQTDADHAKLYTLDKIEYSHMFCLGDGHSLITFSVRKPIVEISAKNLKDLKSLGYRVEELLAIVYSPAYIQAKQMAEKKTFFTHKDKYPRACYAVNYAKNLPPVYNVYWVK